jgi:hypothetical protein
MMYKYASKQRDEADGKENNLWSNGISTYHPAIRARTKKI